MQLEIAGLTSGYGNVTILHGLDFAAKPGEITCVLGPNGAGKSTLMKTIAGQLAVTSGDIMIDRSSIAGHGPLRTCKAGVGYVPQERNVFTELSVRDNLAAASLAFAGAAAKIDDVFRRFPILRERARQRASTLSGGERQTLAISMALLAGPEIILLDEPTAGLAPIFVDRIVDWIKELAAQGMCVIWVVEQNPEKILAISGTTYIIEAGRIKDVLASQSLLAPGMLAQVLL